MNSGNRRLTYPLGYSSSFTFQAASEKCWIIANSYIYPEISTWGLNCWSERDSNASEISWIRRRICHSVVSVEEAGFPFCPDRGHSSFVTETAHKDILAKSFSTTEIWICLRVWKTKQTPRFLQYFMRRPFWHEQL